MKFIKMKVFTYIWFLVSMISPVAVSYKTECCSIVNQINATDREIDGMVYGLYGLSEEEVGIIENKNQKK